jgi:hypothetical protein
MEGSINASVMARQALGTGIEYTELGLKDADTAEVPGSGDEFVEESLLDLTLWVDLLLVLSDEIVEFRLIFWLNGKLFGNEAVFAGVLRTDGLAF